MMRWLPALLLAGFALVSWRAQAACPNCKCDASISSLNFGIYNPVDPAPTQVTTALQISCANLAAGKSVGVNVALSGGKGSYGVRQLIQGDNRLGYNLYVDPVHTMVWGDGTDGTTEASLTVTLGAVRSLTIYGQIPPLQPVPAGSYFDVIVATISY